MIQFDEKTGVFHLSNEHISYVLQVVRGRYLMHRYFGRRLCAFRDSRPFQEIDRGFSPQPAAYENERTFSLDVLPQEYPAYGHTDFRIPAYEVRLADGTTTTELFYQSYEIAKGKPQLQGLPASYAADDEAETLTVHLEDSQGKLAVDLLYTIFAEADVIARSACLYNSGKEALDLLNAASFAMDLPDHDYDRLNLWGGHAAERTLERVPLMHGIEETASRRGSSSHQASPFLALLRRDAGETSGEVLGFSLVWSGEFSLKTEVEQFGTTRVVGGINPFEFRWHLEPGESFQTPEALLVYSDAGLNGMSQAFHEVVRHHIVRGRFRDEVRPILVNNWEATYFDFDDAKMDNLAACAKDLGLELMVLDDGWFGKREDDNSSLGDWKVNTEKLKGGLTGVAESAHKRGLKFGLWFEPEMISVDSDLYRAHPDWALKAPNYPYTFSRHQLVLDLSRADVRDYVVDSVCTILDNAPIDYVKWDFNRHLTDAFSAKLPPERQGEVRTRFVLGLYDVLECITQTHPDVLFESCSGGGGRFDAGMLYYMPQTWTSDDTDAICRLSIQSGTSLVFPPITMGAHVSVTPNHQVGRVTPMQTRAFAAMMGCYGYELDITRMSDEEKAEVRSHVELYKKIRPTMQLGHFYRLLTPFDGKGNETAWEFVSKDSGEIVLVYFKTLATPATEIRTLKLQSLNEDALYEVSTYIPAKGLSHDGAGSKSLSLEGKSFYGDELMYSGIEVPKIDTDFAAYLWIFHKKD